MTARFEKGVEPCPKVVKRRQSVLEDSSESGSRLCSMNLGSGLALRLLCQGDDNCPELGKNELSAHQESALAPLNCTTLAAGVIPSLVRATP